MRLDVGRRPPATQDVGRVELGGAGSCCWRAGEWGAHGRDERSRG